MAEIHTEARAAAGVEAWRRLQLERSGFPAALAERIVHDTRFDLHALIELAEQGCPPELAARILAPLEDPPTPSS